MDICEIRAWILAGAGSAPASFPPVHSDLTMDQGFMITTGEEARYMLVQHEPFDRREIVAELAGPASYWVISDGTDPITGLRHRVTWVFEELGGVIRKILRSSTTIEEMPLR